MQSLKLLPLIELHFTRGLRQEPPLPDAVPEEDITAGQKSQLQQETLMTEDVLSALTTSWMSAGQLLAIPTFLFFLGWGIFLLSPQLNARSLIYLCSPEEVRQTPAVLTARCWAGFRRSPKKEKKRKTVLLSGSSHLAGIWHNHSSFICTSSVWIFAPSGSLPLLPLLPLSDDATAAQHVAQFGSLLASIKIQ